MLKDTLHVFSAPDVGQSVTNNGDLHRLKIMNIVARYSTRLLVLNNSISFLSVQRCVVDNLKYITNYS